MPATVRTAPSDSMLVMVARLSAGLSFWSTMIAIRRATSVRSSAAANRQLLAPAAAPSPGAVVPSGPPPFAKPELPDHCRRGGDVFQPAVEASPKSRRGSGGVSARGFLPDLPQGSACLPPTISLHPRPGRPWSRARSSAGEHYVDIVGVTGSIPVAPTMVSIVYEANRRHQLPMGSTWEATGGNSRSRPTRPHPDRHLRPLAEAIASSSNCGEPIPPRRAIDRENSLAAYSKAARGSASKRSAPWSRATYPALLRR
jgi:hypothetical protein